MTPQEAYQIYHSECLNVKLGKYPKQIQDFSKFENSENKYFFERFCHLIERNGGFINPVLYIRALAKYYRGFFNPKVFTIPTSIRIYKLFIADFNKLNDPDDIYERLLEDLRFVSGFCIENRLFDGLFDYLHHNENFVPSIIKHCVSGEVSFFFPSACETFPIILKNYPSDAVSMIEDYDYKLCRSKLIFDKRCKIICDNLEYLLGSLISKNSR